MHAVGDPDLDPVPARCINPNGIDHESCARKRPAEAEEEGGGRPSGLERRELEPDHQIDEECQKYGEEKDERDAKNALGGFVRALLKEAP